MSRTKAQDGEIEKDWLFSSALSLFGDGWKWTTKTTKEDVPASILFILLVVETIAGVIWSAVSSDSNILLASATLALVIVTALYGWHTRQMAKANTKAAEIAMNSEQNAVIPILKITIAPTIGKNLRVSYENIGKGPALNLQCWLSHEELPALKSMDNRQNNCAVGAGDGGIFVWDTGAGLPDRHLGFDIIAQYDDIFRRSFESRLEYVANGLPMLHYGLLKAPGADKRQWA